MIIIQVCLYKDSCRQGKGVHCYAQAILVYVHVYGNYNIYRRTCSHIFKGKIRLQTFIAFGVDIIFFLFSRN